MALGIANTSGFGRRGPKRMTAAPKLILTPMVDILTIMLVFLIKNYSTTPAFLTPTQEINLAETSSEMAAPNEAVLIVGKDGILVEGQVVVPFKDGRVAKGYLSKGMMPALQDVLMKMAQKTKTIAASNDSVKFSGTLILQADKSIPFDSLKPVLRTAGIAGYNDIKFAGQFLD